jgi:hypothetical protein
MARKRRNAQEMGRLGQHHTTAIPARARAPA